MFIVSKEQNLFERDYIVSDLNITKPFTSIKTFNSNNGSIAGFTTWGNALGLIKYSFNSPHEIIYYKKLPNPALSLSFRPLSSDLLLGSCMGSVTYLNLDKKIEIPLYSHSIGTKEVQWVDNNIIISGGWDGKIILLDIRQKEEAFMQKFNHRIYAMDIIDNTLLCGMSENIYGLFDLRNFEKKQSRNTKVKYPITSVSINKDGSSFCFSYTSGEIEVKSPDLGYEEQYTSINSEINDFVFLAHQSDNNEVYSVNQIKFIDKDVLVSVGSNGLCVFWDIGKKKKIYYGATRKLAPIICFDYCKESNTSGHLVYATGNDFSKGPLFLKNPATNQEMFTPEIGFHKIYNN